MEFKFVSGDAKDLKRKRPYGACEACKKRKKRCFHGEDGDEDDQSCLEGPTIPLFQPPVQTKATTLGGDLNRVGSSNVSSYQGTKTTDTTSRRIRHSSQSSISYADSKGAGPRYVQPSKPPRFIGDCHAEAVLEVERDIDSDRRDMSGVGVWVDANDEELESESEQAETEAEAVAVLPKNPLLADEDKRALISIFIARVQPLLPVLEAGFNDIAVAINMNEVLSWAVCLVACKDQRAQPYRRLNGSDAVLPVATFASRLHRAISRRVPNWRSFDRLVLIRILLLMSLHQEGTDGAEVASMHLSEAVHHAYSMGLHLKRVSLDSKAQQDTARLFWCIWSWDKVSSAHNGRARMTYELDVGLCFDDSLELFDTPARLWMKLARLLSSVCDLYNPRPKVDTESHIKDFPRWEFLLEEEDTSGMDEGFLTTLELFYHSCSMLSCRIKLLVGRRRAFASSLRRDLSAATIYWISKCTPPEDLAPLPVVPYAYCLATLVAYQQYRCSKHKVHLKIAETQLMHFQEQLQTISPYWHAAKSMSRKTQRVLHELRRRNGTEINRPRTGADSVGTFASSKLSTISTPSIASPDLGNKMNPSPGPAYNPMDIPKYPNQIGFNSFQTNYQDPALADMDVTFGNLMDMNAFTGDIEFAFGPYLQNGYDAAAAQEAVWPGVGIGSALS